MPPRHGAGFDHALAGNAGAFDLRQPLAQLPDHRRGE